MGRIFLPPPPPSGNGSNPRRQLEIAPAPWWDSKTQYYEWHPTAFCALCDDGITYAWRILVKHLLWHWNRCAWIEPKFPFCIYTMLWQCKQHGTSFYHTANDLQAMQCQGITWTINNLLHVLSWASNHRRGPRIACCPGHVTVCMRMCSAQAPLMPMQIYFNIIKNALLWYNNVKI